jgi:hypothetical protein
VRYANRSKEKERVCNDVAEGRRLKFSFKREGHAWDDLVIFSGETPLASKQSSNRAKGRDRCSVNWNNDSF